MDLTFGPIDNHCYATLDACPRYLAPAFRDRGVQVVQQGRHQLVLAGGRAFRFIPNPTLDPIIVPGCLDLVFRGQVPEAALSSSSWDARWSRPTRRRAGGAHDHHPAAVESFMPTPMTTYKCSELGGREQEARPPSFAPRVPMPRLGTVDDVANAIGVLSSDQASITGQELVVDGGYVVR
jgi:hypothetical protein